MTLGIEREGLAAPLRRLAGVDEGGGSTVEPAGVPVLGSCAGLIMLDRDHLAIMDIRAERNAFGRQLRSFEANLDVKGLSGGPMRGIFIRAPWIAEHSPDVEILAEIDGHPVAARQGHVTAVAFHTELGSDTRLHRLFLADVLAKTGSAGEPSPEGPIAEVPEKVAFREDADEDSVSSSS